MKSTNSGRLRSFVIATSIALTFSGVAVLCSAQPRSHQGATLNSVAGSAISEGSIQGPAERLMVEPARLNQVSNLVAQAGGLWCYTSYGRYPMLILAPVGSVCNVNVNFYPYVLQGTVGFGHPAKPPILQGTDCKWWGWKEALADVGITVTFLSPEYAKAKYEEKIGSD
jgi:hypothetical protein